MYYTLPNAIGEPYRLNFVQYHAFHDNGGDYKFATGGLQPGNRILSGNLRVWTDMMVNTADSVLYKYVYVNYEGKNMGISVTTNYQDLITIKHTEVVSH